MQTHLLLQIVASILSLVPSIIIVEGGFVDGYSWFCYSIFFHCTNRMAQIIVLAVISVIAYLFDSDNCAVDDDLRCDSYVFLQR